MLNPLCLFLTASFRHSVLQSQKLFSLSLMICVVSACGSSTSVKPKLYYEGTMIRSPVPKKGEKSLILNELKTVLKKRKVFVIKRSKKEMVYGAKINRLKTLTHPELKAIWIAESKRYIRAELDLKIITLKKDSVPVTAWVGLDRSITVEQGQWKRSEVPSGAKEVEDRWGVGPLRVKRGAKWSKRSLRSINLALSKLSKQEIKIIKGIPFVRKKKGQSASQAALYIQEGDCDAFIHVFNLAIKSERYTFSGEARKALPATVEPILHEIGHAVHNYPSRLSQCEYLKKVKDYNKKVNRANKAKGGERKRLMNELDRDENKVNTLKKKAHSLRGKGPVLKAYLKVRGKKKGPTPYGETSAEESFAESFALYRVDPKALKRVFPNVYSWFRKDGHLKALKRF